MGFYGCLWKILHYKISSNLIVYEIPSQLDKMAFALGRSPCLFFSLICDGSVCDAHASRGGREGETNLFAIKITLQTWQLSRFHSTQQCGLLYSLYCCAVYRGRGACLTRVSGVVSRLPSPLPSHCACINLALSHCLATECHVSD